MSEYRLDVTGNLQLSDYSNIHDYMGIISDDDKLTIAMEDNSSDNVGIICSMLQNNKFNISTQGGHGDGKYYIIAYRRR